MRFKAKIDNVATFSRIVQTVERITKTCVIRFTRDTLYIICSRENEGGVQIWSKIKNASLFSDYRIQSNSNDEISMEVPTQPLSQALRSAQSSAEVTVKLAKKNDRAVLSFDVQVVSAQGKTVRVTHDVRITVMKVSDVEKLEEPHCPEPDVHISLPPLSKLRTVTEHLKQISDYIEVSANHSGEFSLRLSTDEVGISTTWTGCEKPGVQNESQEEQPPDPKVMHPAVVSVKSFLHFLSSYVVSSTTIACICVRHCLIMYVYIGDMEEAGGVLTFYIPARLE